MASTAPTGHLAPVASPHSYLDRVESLRDSAVRLQRESNARLRESNTCLRESNACLPIGRLPLEILSAIFTEAAIDDCWQRWTRGHIASVSHHWREVALATPSMWSKLSVCDLYDVAPMQQSLSRTANCPLDISLFTSGDPVGPDWELDDAQFFLDAIPRAHSLYVDTDTSNICALRWPQISNSLKSLTLFDHGFLDEEESSEIDHRANIPLSLFRTLDVRFPNLQTLKAGHLGVTLDELHPPGSLVNLYIDNHIHFSATRLHDPLATLNVLRKLPALERLSLVNATAKLDAKAMDDLDPVSLPQLKFISFSGPITTCLPLLKTLKLPHSVRRHLKLSRTKSDARSLHNELMTQLINLEDSFRSVIVGSNYDCWLKILAWKEAQPMEILDHLGIQDNTSWIEEDPPREYSADVLVEFTDQKIGHEHALRHKSLFSHVRGMVLYEPLGRILENSLHTQLHELEELSCEFEPTKENKPDQQFFQRLTERSSSFPRLRILRLRWFSFAAAYYDALLVFCQERERMGVKLDVRLSLCFEVSEAKLDELRTITESVSWDGQMPSRRLQY